MPEKFYTSVEVQENKIFHRFFDGEKRQTEILENYPFVLYVPSDRGKGDAIGFMGEKLSSIRFNSVKETNEYIRKNRNYRQIHGQTSLAHQFIATEYPDLIKFDITKINILNFDIEVAFDVVLGYSPPDVADNEVTSITLATFAHNTTYITIGTKTFTGHCNPDELYIECDDERHLLMTFVNEWIKIEPDIITGFNINEFDIPYIINRIKKVLGKQWADRLSPFYKKARNVISEIELDNLKKGYKILGISPYDYIEMYKKFSTQKLGSYSLDNIALVELSERKVDYSEFGSLHNLYNGILSQKALKSNNDLEILKIGRFKERVQQQYGKELPIELDYIQTTKFDINILNVDLDKLNANELIDVYFTIDNYIKEYAYNKFVEYNTQDVRLPRKLDAKLNYIFIGLTIAYMCKVKQSEIFGQVKNWECLVYNALRKKGIQIPPAPQKQSSDGYAGAFVKEPIPGLYKWVVAFDLTSLYPSIMRMLNVSYETLVKTATGNLVEDLIDLNVDTAHLKKLNCAMAANGAMFSKDKIGIIPEIITEMFNDRVSHKTMRIAADKKIELIKTELSKRGTTKLANLMDAELKNELEKLYTDSAFHEAMQIALKLALNSCYGSCGNAGFRYSSNDMAEGITLTGQLVILYIAKRLNEFLNSRFKTNGVDYVIYSDTDSVVGDTVISMDCGDMKIGNLFDSINTIPVKNEIDNIVKPVFNLNAYGVDINGKLVVNPIKYVMAHKVKKELFKITVDGTEIICTADHSLIVNRDGKNISIKPTEVISTDKFIKLMK